MKEFPNPINAVMRPDYLSEERGAEPFRGCWWIYTEEEADGTPDGYSKQAIDFMRTEKPKLMAAWKIEDENNPRYGAMISALKEMTIKGRW